MSKYKLHYFTVTGRGEVCRYLFKLANQPFDDIRYSMDEWKDKKADTPFGQLPYMEIDGVTICQSRTMERLLAKRFNRYGSNDMEQAKSDMVVDCLEDILQEFFKKTEGEDDGKHERRRKWIEESFPDHAAKLEQFATPTGFIEGKPVMWPDLALNFLLDVMELFAFGGKEKVSLEKTPKLLAISKIVLAEPKICQWIKERPENIMPSM